MKSVADIFIIESLHPENEGNGWFEGHSISHLAKLHEKRPIYKYVRTRKQLVEAVSEFHSSRYRYLHISAHADRDGITLTDDEEISNSDLAKMLGEEFAGKRLFMSACKAVHKNMATEIISKTGCYSVIGPKKSIDFSEAVVFWSALYHIMFTKSLSSMKRSDLANSLRKVADLIEVDIGYYSSSRSAKSGAVEIILKG